VRGYVPRPSWVGVRAAAGPSDSWHTGHVSAVVIGGFAAVCVGVIWYERWQVRRSAVRRGLERRAHQPWREWALRQPPTDPTMRHLAASVGRAIVAADVAWSYRDLYDRTRGTHESPFELRRGRMEASAHRYAASLERVVDTARRLVDPRMGSGFDAHRRDVIERLVDVLEPRAAAARRTDTLRALELDVDILEATLVHLHDDRTRHVVEDPFRW
jgi:hypothetical protein